ncbi:hypothetical protein BJ912DRAFT_1044739 [Pholiota molesta]|nr:hypothetical protein BJ912DRAFT_1044739 [Pholiota molesta]
MNSSTSRSNALKLTQDQLKQQIAELQARLLPEPEPDATAPAPKSPKRKAPEPITLAPATPSPKKKRKIDHPTGKPLARPVFQTSLQQTSALRADKEDRSFTFLNKLATINRTADPADGVEQPSRSTGFTEKPREIQPPAEEKLAQKRDERLALIDSLEPGPYEYAPPYDDPDFARLEPHSGINLISRIIPHEDFSDYLRGRYYLSPSRLYSAIRLLPNKQGYDVPVPGDWITIGVVAERGPIKFTRAPVKIEREEGDESEKRKWKGKGKARQSQKNRERNSGDAFLTLLLFEADSFEVVDHGDGRKPEKVYRGGVGEGDVIALLNPKILKPFQRSGDTPHPVNNVLAVTPESASSILVIGRSRDLGMCQVRKQDGKVCGSWCDKRLGDVCEYHVQSAVQRRRAARPEFSIGSGGMSNAPTHKRKHDYDPRKQWAALLLIHGRYTRRSPSARGPGQGQAQNGGKDADKALTRLLERDKDGMKAVMKAREVGYGGGAVKTKGEKKKKKAGKAYSADIIKSLGFDPSMKPGQRRLESTGTKNKLDALEAVQGFVLVSRRQLERKPMYDLDDSADDEFPEKLSTNNVMNMKEPIEEKMVDLDDL